jgi:GTPases
MHRENPTGDPPLRQASVDLVSPSNYLSTTEFDTVFTSRSSPRDHANISSRRGMIETRPKRQAERALLIGLEQNGVSKWDLRDSMEELRELASSAGAEVVDTVTQKLPRPTAPFYIGKGKAEAIRDSVQSQRVTSVIFNDELSPAQGRNLENLFSRKVLDRTQLILDIFAQRARSREGRLQIELAQLQYLLPRLTRMWHHLSARPAELEPADQARHSWKLIVAGCRNGSRVLSASWKACAKCAVCSGRAESDTSGR